MRLIINDNGTWLSLTNRIGSSLSAFEPIKCSHANDAPIL